MLRQRTLFYFEATECGLRLADPDMSRYESVNEALQVVLQPSSSAEHSGSVWPHTTQFRLEQCGVGNAWPSPD